MQVPTTIDGLRQALGTLGFPSLLDGLDPNRPDIQEVLEAQLNAEFDLSDQTEADEDSRAKAMALITQFTWPKAPGSTTTMNDKTKKAVDAALEAILMAGDLVRFPTEKARALPPVKNGPPAKVMNIKKVDEPNKEVTLAPGKQIPEYQPTDRGEGSRYDQKMDVKDIAKIVRSELADLAKKGQIPKFKYRVRIERFAGGSSIDVFIASGRDSVESMFNLPVLLTEMLQGYGRMPYGEKYQNKKPALVELQKLIEKKLRDFNHDRSDTQTDYWDVKFYAHVEVEGASQKAVEDKLRGDYMRVMGSDKPLFTYQEFARNPAGAVEKYAEVLKEAGYSDRELSASTLARISAKPTDTESGDLIKKYAKMFYSAMLGAPEEVQSGSKEAYLAHLKDMQKKYPTVDLETPEFEKALHNEAQSWWQSRKVRGSGVDW